MWMLCSDWHAIPWRCCASAFTPPRSCISWVSVSSSFARGSWNVHFWTTSRCIRAALLSPFQAEGDSPTREKNSVQQAIFRVNVTLSIPNIAMVPALEEVQQALNRVVECVVSVSKGVSQWSKERISKVGSTWRSKQSFLRSGYRRILLTHPSFHYCNYLHIFLDWFFLYYAVAEHTRRSFFTLVSPLQRKMNERRMAVLKVDSSESESEDGATLRSLAGMRGHNTSAQQLRSDFRVIYISVLFQTCRPEH